MQSVRPLSLFPFLLICILKLQAAVVARKEMVDISNW